jgi:hypothetical protein
MVLGLKMVHTDHISMVTICAPKRALIFSFCNRVIYASSKLKIKVIPDLLPHEQYYLKLYIPDFTNIACYSCNGLFRIN